ncbi:MAG TPA: sigma-54 dependent transcriptional regulator [Myxococcota bacterium]|nr:sigma-54 dependent transcriptional regulator [Myxococcota bacterium]HRY95867.1 sigma-54 dependent transcriptional regulator [Myxococcota bacterium]
MSETPAPVPGQRILVIDDESVVCLSISRILTAGGHRVECRTNPLEGLELATRDPFDVILLDLMMPEMGGLEVLKRLREGGGAAEVVIITGYGTVTTAVEAMKLGAAEYILKPFSPEELELVMARVLARSHLLKECSRLRVELERQQGNGEIVGASRAMERVFGLIRRVAPTQGTVLITGESGTGKEMVARAIHDQSPRRDRPFLACDCSSLAPSLLESELFGHAKGSFTGALGAKQGLFEAASSGSLFLDEVSNISYEIQGKLLRVLEARRVKPVGDTEEREVDIRLIAATSRDLAVMVGEGTFREDLFYRLNVVPIHLPPLREREGDVLRLATLFLERFRRQNEVQVKGFSPEAMRLLESYRWPGNVRELKNIVERLAILCDAERIEPQHLPPEIRQARGLTGLRPLPRDWETFKELKRQVRDAAVQELERRFLLEALQRSGGNVSRASEDVGMQRTQFHQLLRKYGLGGEQDEGTEVPGPPPQDPELD